MADHPFRRQRAPTPLALRSQLLNTPLESQPRRRVEHRRHISRTGKVAANNVLLDCDFALRYLVPFRPRLELRSTASRRPELRCREIAAGSAGRILLG